MKIEGLAQQLFDGNSAEWYLEEILEEAGVVFEKIGWDHYDVSLELYGVPADFRLNGEQQRLIYRAGFATVYVNHVDRWETHYNWSKDFEESKGWRVSYPHKREKGSSDAIWVEEFIPSWPKKWFDTGYVIIKKLCGK